MNVPTKTQSSIARMMIVILFVAVDAFLLRLTYRRTHIPPYDMGAFLLVPTLQVAMLLAFSLRGHLRPFWAGFLAAGAVVLLLYSGVRGPFHEMPGSWSSAVYHLLRARGVDLLQLSDSESVCNLVMSAYCLVVVGLPLLLLCVASGLAVSRAVAATRSRAEARVAA